MNDENITLIEVESIMTMIDACRFERATALALAAIVQRLDEIIAVTNAQAVREAIAAGDVRER